MDSSTLVTITSFTENFHTAGICALLALVGLFITAVLYIHRIKGAILFGILLNMGVIGIALAMCLDWMIRALFFWVRFRSGKWKEFRVIG